MSLSKAVKSKRTDVSDASGISVLTSVIASVPASGIVTGQIVSIEEDGELFIDYPGNTIGPTRAKTLARRVQAGATVLIVFERGNNELPIVLGVLHDGVQTRRKVLRLKARKIVLEADEELLLRCGESSVSATQGKIVLKGRDLVSRAARINKVRGATVLIN